MSNLPVYTQIMAYAVFMVVQTFGAVLSFQAYSHYHVMKQRMQLVNLAPFESLFGFVTCMNVYGATTNLMKIIMLLPINHR